MIERSFRSRLVVLTLRLTCPVLRVARLVEALITWPGQTDDGRCRTLVGQLYKALALGDTVAQAHTNSCAALEGRPPHAPLLTETGHGTVLF